MDCFSIAASNTVTCRCSTGEGAHTPTSIGNISKRRAKWVASRISYLRLHGSQRLLIFVVIRRMSTKNAFYVSFPLPFLLHPSSSILRR